MLSIHLTVEFLVTAWYKFRGIKTPETIVFIPIPTILLNDDAKEFMP